MANPGINWGMVSDGATFESLMQALAYANEPGVRMFGRLGKDQGMDARSSDGTRVYQAKYIGSHSFEEAIERAKKELSKIREYRASEHANFEAWQSVNTWILVSNVYTNNLAFSRWDSEVSKPFASLGISAELWSCEVIEQELMNHPEIREAFFGDGNRTLLYPSEAYANLITAIPGVRFDTLPFVGREADVSKVKNFLQSSVRRVLVVTGAHGVGRTRFLYESMTIAAQHMRVFWGRAEEMQKSDRWYGGMSRPQPTVLFVDDCNDLKLLNDLLGLLSLNEQVGWKVVISYPSEAAPQLNPRLLSLTEEEVICLGPAKREDVKRVCKAFSPNVADVCAERIASYTKGNFSFISFFLDCIQKHGRDFLSGDVLAWASHYVSTSLSQAIPHDTEDAKKVLRRLALLGTITLTNDPQDLNRNFLRDGWSGNIDSVLKGLKIAGLVRYVRYGGDRYAIASPLIQQLVLSEWLLSAVSGTKYEVSEAGRDIIQSLLQGRYGGLTDVILETLSHLASAYLPKAEGETFMSPLFVEIRKAANEGPTTMQLSCVELLKKIGRNDLESTIDIVSDIIDHDDVKEAEVSHPWYGKTLVTRGQVLSELPQMAYDISSCLGRRDAGLMKKVLLIFEKLIHLEDSKAFNLTGSDCKSFVQRLMTPMPGCDIFQPIALKILETRAAELKTSPFVYTLAESMLIVERSSMESIGRSVHFCRGLVPIDEKNPSWIAVKSCWDFIWKRLEQTSDVDTRVVLWRLISKGVSSFYGAELCVRDERSSGYVSQYQSMALEVLKEIRLRLKSSGLDEREILAMRNIWRRHLPYVEDEKRAESDFASEAKVCEALYVAGDDVAAYARRLYRSRSGESDSQKVEVEKVVQKFLVMDSVDQVETFFATGKIILDPNGSDDGFSDYGLTWELSHGVGEVVSLSSDSVVSAFVRKSIAEYPSENKLINTFVYVFIDSCIRDAKTRSTEELMDVLRLAIARTPNKSRLLRDVYANTHVGAIGSLLPEEYSFIVSELPNLDYESVRGLVPQFVGVCREAVLSELERAFDRYSSKAEDLLWRIVNEWYMQLIRESLSPDETPVNWLIEQVANRNEIPLDIFNNYHFEALFDRAKTRASCSCLVKILVSGRKFEYGVKLSRYFKKVHRGELFDVCACIVGDMNAEGVPSYFNLPNYLAELDVDAEDARSYIDTKGQITTLTSDDLKSRLRCLARLASGYTNDSKQWERIAEPILTRADMLDKKTRLSVYRLLGPSFRIFGGLVGEVPKEIRSRYELAKSLFEQLNGDSTSPFYAYREWDYECAKSEFDEAVERAKVDHDDDAL